MIKERIKRMGHYKPPLEGRSEKGYLLLDFNERTSAPGEHVKEALIRFVESNKLHVYPEYGEFEAKIAKYALLNPENVMATNGGDQGIDVICQACLDEGDRAIIPFPSFAMHYQAAGVRGAEISEPKYSDAGQFPLDEVLRLMDDDKTQLIIICNPNNPLGSVVSIQDIEKILQKGKERNVNVMHDEAYFEFSGFTCKDLIDKYDNLFIIRTFAKAFGLVAARAGYVISSAANIQELLKVRGPYDVNMFAKTAIEAALSDVRYMQDYVKEVMQESKPRLESFLKTKGVFFYPSQANFLMVNIPHSEKLTEYLKENGILVRPKSAPDQKIAARITVGTQKDTDRLISILDRFF